MRIHQWLGAFLLIPMAYGQGMSSENCCCEPVQGGILQRFRPVGGWHPYGGGLLRWWPRHCFPYNGGPNDYCPKPLPKVCWPPYPPYYIWELQTIHPPQGNGCPTCNPLP